MDSSRRAVGVGPAESCPSHGAAAIQPGPRPADHARTSTTEVVQGAWNALAALRQEVGGDHGGGHRVVPEPWLHGAEVGAAWPQVGGEGVPQGMGAERRRQSGTANRPLDGLVEDAGVHVMATGDTGTRGGGHLPGGEDVRPTPCLGGLRGLASERMGPGDLAMPVPHVLLRPRLDPSQVALEHRGECRGNGGDAVLGARARADGQWLQRNIDVLDPQPDRLHEAHAAPVAQLGHQLGGAVQPREDRGDGFAGHAHGDVDLLGSAYGLEATLHDLMEDARVEAHQGLHGRVLGRGRDVSMHRQVGQERLDLGFGGAEVGARPHTVATGEPLEPFPRGALGMNGVVVETEHLAHVIK
jgi:hypothetical protein